MIVGSIENIQSSLQKLRHTGNYNTNRIARANLRKKIKYKHKILTKTLAASDKLSS